MERFLSPSQYDYFKQLVRSEMPSHIAVRFEKLGRAKMLKFEESYFNWLKIKTDATMEAPDLREVTNQLVKILNDF